MAQLHRNLTAHWMYTATNQLALNGSEPAWSKDGWSFVPLDLRNVSLLMPGKVDNKDQDDIGQSSRVNVSTTPAIRGRIECSPHEG
jgi:hypothetical protein